MRERNKMYPLSSADLIAVLISHPCYGSCLICGGKENTSITVEIFFKKSRKSNWAGKFEYTRNYCPEECDNILWYLSQSSKTVARGVARGAIHELGIWEFQAFDLAKE
ncbi:hypothetical protein BgiMline_024341 [Biomphalaria glabrata]|nr:hypothetical protein BgiMline_007546 [Biomphalaria glabrata]